MADYGIKIAKAGHHIRETDPESYHFWSKYKAKSVKYQGSLNVTTLTGINPAAQTNTYTHNFGYIPQFMVFATSAIENAYVNCDWNLTVAYDKSGDLQEEFLLAYSTSTTIVVSALWDYFTPMSGFTNGLAHTYSFDILLFMEEVETS